MNDGETALRAPRAGPPLSARPALRPGGVEEAPRDPLICRSTATAAAAVIEEAVAPDPGARDGEAEEPAQADLCNFAYY